MTSAKSGAAQVPELNRLAVLRSISQRAAFTKMDVVREARLSLPTVREILASLQTEGYLVPVGNGQSRGGRPPALYRFNPRARCVIGIEVKVPRLSVGLVDLQANLIGLVEYPFGASATSEYVTDKLEQGIAHLLTTYQVEPGKLVGIGLGVPGFVQRDTGVWLGFPRVPRIKDLPLRSLLARRFEVPIHIQNEVNVCAAAALQRLGQAIQANGDILFITCAEGLKATVVADGRMLSGDHGNFGSIGHFIVAENGRLCHCGARGCLEMYASGFAFREAIRSRGLRIPGLSDLEDPSLPDHVFGLAAAGDPACRALVEEAVPYMAYAFASLIRLTDIAHVVLLGAYAEGGDHLRGLLYQRMAQRLPEVARTGLSVHMGAKLRTEDVVVTAAVPAIRAHLGLA